MAQRATAMTVEFMAWDTTNNVPKTGDSANLVMRWVKDGTSAALTTATVTEIDSTNAPGIYKVGLNSTETDCLVGMLHGKSSTSAIYVMPQQFGFVQTPNAVPGAAGGLTIAGSNAATTFATLTSTGAFSINGTSNVAQTGDSFARIGATGSGLTSLAPSATALSTAVWTGVPTGFLAATFPTGTIANTTNITAASGCTLSATGSAAFTEGYRTDGSTGTLAQLLYEIVAHLGESSITSTTKTIKKLDGSTTAATFSLNDATTPTSITRAT